MRRSIILTILSGVLILPGLICFAVALRRPTATEKMLKKEITVYGKGGKIHLIYLGIAMISMGIYIAVKANDPVH